MRLPSRPRNNLSTSRSDSTLVDKSIVTADSEYNEDSKPKEITFSLICKKNIPNEREYTKDELADQVYRLTHLRLDRSNLTQVSNLELFNRLTHCYLQRNNIRTIENLETLIWLRFLILSENQLVSTAGLNCLSRLEYLDVSHNQIAEISDDLPKSIRYLQASGNPCALLPSYKIHVLAILPKLLELDEQPVSKEERRLASLTLQPRSPDAARESEADYEDGDSDESVDELFAPSNDSKPDISSEEHQQKYDNMLNGIIAESRKRQEKGTEDYDAKIAALKQRIKAWVLEKQHKRTGPAAHETLE
ncbi:uncharacterized protein BJ171DRAFT_619766 [Polychytrium aggregatum]|uniref:uncharacterized protein n=1 Tax=Polychytrium aggregatum TaxID=110093 RepID=UPI0022FF260D|nr:uncharacterized protein BJ171DRAFT_619766 [Polychytrium aggregatum]KAI9204496.1 hypothetical protein BJ171DRAFT_619766 [Polychytrium aggregatum]